MIVQKHHVGFINFICEEFISIDLLYGFLYFYVITYYELLKVDLLIIKSRLERLYWRDYYEMNQEHEQIV